MLRVKTEQEHIFNITHLGLDGSSRRVVGRSVTKLASIEHAHSSIVKCFFDNQLSDVVKLMNKRRLSYLSRNRSFVVKSKNNQNV